MKHLYAILSFLLIIAVCWFSFYGTVPNVSDDQAVPASEFSVLRASIPLEEIAKEPHYLGSDAHDDVRNFLIEELRKLGLEPHIQEGFSYNSKSKTLNKPINIAARLPGSEEGKALLLLSHYDSAAIHSYGASDDGVGLVSILESFRAYLASGSRPKNDIIILFTDAEEIGLDGAKLFMDEHPWASEVGLVLNLEARGTSGPSNMILETNGGNSELIKAFSKADTPYPIASSMMYSVYKMLPNDTDSTVFREEGDIDSFFFAFIDDHFNYHTSNDNLENLNWKSFQHQGSYLLPLIHYFAEADLNTLKSDTDHVYFNFPMVKMLFYPFNWILPMLLLAVLGFVGLLYYGFRKNILQTKLVLIGFIPFTLSLVLSGLAGYSGWKIIQVIYPQYAEIQQGFTYNGHAYIALFVSISLAISFSFYRRFKTTENKASLMVAPLFFWLVLNIVILVVLKGAAYFIIPVLFALIAFYLMLRKKEPNLLLLSILSIPALFIFAPLIQYFPVGLGLKMLVLSSVFTVLLFGLVLPVFAYYKENRLLAITFTVLTIFFIVQTHRTSSFSPERQRPNSLLYYTDADEGNSYWLTYDKTLDDWTKAILGENPKKASDITAIQAYSKYGRNYTYASEAPKKDIPNFEVVLTSDTLINNEREVGFTILPKRRINRLELYSEQHADFTKLAFNGKKVDLSTTSDYYRGTQNPALVNYHVSKGDSLHVAYSIPKDAKVNFRAMEYSYDLLEHPGFAIEKRPDFTMPKPFVVTDAIAVKRSFSMDSIRRNVSVDSTEIDTQKISRR